MAIRIICVRAPRGLRGLLKILLRGRKFQIEIGR